MKTIRYLAAFGLLALAGAAPMAEHRQIDGEDGVNQISEKDTEASQAGDVEPPGLISRVSALIKQTKVQPRLPVLPARADERILQSVQTLFYSLGLGVPAEGGVRQVIVPSFDRLEVRQEVVTELDQIRQSEQYWKEVESYIDTVCGFAKRFVARQLSNVTTAATTTVAPATTTTVPVVVPEPAATSPRNLDHHESEIKLSISGQSASIHVSYEQETTAGFVAESSVLMPAQVTPDSPVVESPAQSSHSPVVAVSAEPEVVVHSVSSGQMTSTVEKVPHTTVTIVSKPASHPAISIETLDVDPTVTIVKSTSVKPTPSIATAPSVQPQEPVREEIPVEPTIAVQVPSAETTESFVVTPVQSVTHMDVPSVQPTPSVTVPHVEPTVAGDVVHTPNVVPVHTETPVTASQAQTPPVLPAESAEPAVDVPTEVVPAVEAAHTEEPVVVAPVETTGSTVVSPAQPTTEQPPAEHEAAPTLQPFRDPPAAPSFLSTSGMAVPPSELTVAAPDQSGDVASTVGPTVPVVVPAIVPEVLTTESPDTQSSAVAAPIETGVSGVVSAVEPAVSTVEPAVEPAVPTVVSPVEPAVSTAVPTAEPGGSMVPPVEPAVPAVGSPPGFSSVGEQPVPIGPSGVEAPPVEFKSHPPVFVVVPGVQTAQQLLQQPFIGSTSPVVVPSIQSPLSVGLPFVQSPYPGMLPQVQPAVVVPPISPFYTDSAAFAKVATEPPVPVVKSRGPPLVIRPVTTPLSNVMPLVEWKEARQTTEEEEVTVVKTGVPGLEVERHVDQSPAP